MDLQLIGKNICLIGGTKGVGLALLHTLAAEQANLLIVSRNPQAINDLINEAMQEHSVKIFTLAADITDPATPDKIAKSAGELFPTLDGIFTSNHADISSKSFEETSDKDWQNAFDNFVLGPVRCVRALLPLMASDRHSAVVFTGAFSARMPAVAASEYAAMKAALVNVTKSLAIELAPRKITVNAVCPGFILTERSQKKFEAFKLEQGLTDLEAERGVIDNTGMRIALQRMARPQEIANMAAFLLSGRSSYTTGLIANIDGGTEF